MSFPPMRVTTPPADPLDAAADPGLRFVVGGWCVRPLGTDEVPALQALFEANPDYFEQVGGQPPRPEEAQLEFEEEVPAHLPHGVRFVSGVFDARGALRGVLIAVSDLGAVGVWHIALYLLDGPLRGTGLAAQLHDALLEHARSQGAEWMRLTVIQGNARAERFWTRAGYRPARTWPYDNASGQTVTAQVMVKPLGSRDLADYFRLVPRDAPVVEAP